MDSTPRRARAALARRQDCALLESGPGYGELGRFGIYAAAPRATFEVNRRSWRLSSGWQGSRPPSDASPFEALRFLLRQTSVEANDSDVFQGGWIGILGYDLAPLIECVPRRLRADGALPDLLLAYFDTFALHDVRTGALRIGAVDRFGEGESARAERLARFRGMLEEESLEDRGGALVGAAPTSNFTPDEYCWTVERILEYIRAGDIFQANFAHRFSAPLTGPVELLHARATDHSPAPFGALIRHGRWSVLSTSPERFFEVTPSRHVVTRPIKGTRPRGRDCIHDLLLRAELGASAKDRAELTMIVDLERNDLGRVCSFGSVRVADHARVESFPNVHHLVSTVEGTLHPRYDRIDLLKALFPGGSITGAPKIRAMQIIDELERCRRGPYTGAIGYFSDHGRADFNIAIRTLVVDGDHVHYHVGGGIVADSDPLQEYRETLSKGRRLRDILLGEMG